MTRLMLSIHLIHVSFAVSVSKSMLASAMGCVLISVWRKLKQKTTPLISEQWVIV